MRYLSHTVCDAIEQGHSIKCLLFLPVGKQGCHVYLTALGTGMVEGVHVEGKQGLLKGSFLEELSI